MRRMTSKGSSLSSPCHRRQTLAELLADAQTWSATIIPAEVLSQLGSPFAPDQPPRSNVLVLTTMGTEVTLVAPPMLLPARFADGGALAD